MTREREELNECLLSGGCLDAARRARALARAGAWDLIVAATLILHAPEDGPERAEAEARLEVALLAGDLIDEPGHRGRLAELLEALVATDRVDVALHGLRLATRSQQAGVEGWLHLVVALYAAGKFVPASEAAEEALLSFPDEARLSSVAAHLHLANGHLDSAAEVTRTGRRSRVG